MLRYSKQAGWIMRCLAISVIAGMIIPYMWLNANAAESIQAVDGSVELYEWKRVYDPKKDLKQNDGDTMRAIFLWPANDDKTDWWFTKGPHKTSNTKLYSSTLSGSDPWIDAGADRFLTLGDYGSMRIRFYDHIVDGYPAYVIAFIDENGRWDNIRSNLESEILGFKDGKGYDAPFTITDHKCADGFISVYDYQPTVFEWDVNWEYEDNYIYGDSSVSYNLMDFMMYVGEPTKFDAITNDLVIKNNQAVNISNDTFLLDGNTITVEEGGLLVINGTFFLNGMIENNGGTVIINDGGVVTPLCATGSEEHGYKSNQGTLMIMEGGVMTLDSANREADAETVFSTDESTIMVDGTLMLADEFVIYNSNLDVTVNGGFYVGGMLDVPRVNLGGKSHDEIADVSDFDTHNYNERTCIFYSSHLNADGHVNGNNSKLYTDEYSKFIIGNDPQQSGNFEHCPKLSTR